MLAIIEDIENEDKKSILSNWYKKYNRIMRKKAYDIIGDYHTANDMVNEAFIKIIRNFEKINKLSYGIYICHPWLIDSITSNKIIISIARDYTLLFPLFLFLFALGVSMFFSKLMLKTKIGRFLIG